MVGDGCGRERACAAAAAWSLRLAVARPRARSAAAAEFNRDGRMPVLQRPLRARALSQLQRRFTAAVGSCRCPLRARALAAAAAIRRGSCCPRGRAGHSRPEHACQTNMQRFVRFPHARARTCAPTPALWVQASAAGRRHAAPHMAQAQAGPIARARARVQLRAHRFPIQRLQQTSGRSLQYSGRLWENSGMFSENIRNVPEGSGNYPERSGNLRGLLEVPDGRKTPDATRRERDATRRATRLTTRYDAFTTRPYKLSVSLRGVYDAIRRIYDASATRRDATRRRRLGEALGGSGRLWEAPAASGPAPWNLREAPGGSGRFRGRLRGACRRLRELREWLREAPGAGAGGSRKGSGEREASGRAPGSSTSELYGLRGPCRRLYEAPGGSGRGNPGKSPEIPGNSRKLLETT